MKYLLLICTPEPEDREHVRLEPGRDQVPALADAWAEEMSRRGVRVTGSPVRPPSEATTVRVRGGELLITDGPYADTKEQIGGFDIIDCEDLDQAIDIASQHPMARFGMIDIRALYD